MDLKRVLVVFILIVSACNRTSTDVASEKKDTLQNNKILEKDSIQRIDKEVVDYAANYLIGRKLFEEFRLQTPITLEKVKELHYVYFLEKQNFDTVEVELYKFGTYSNNDEDRVLIKKSTTPRFQVIGDSTRVYDMVMIHRFIKQYSKFSDSIKLKLYEYCIDSYTYDRTYLE